MSTMTAPLVEISDAWRSSSGRKRQRPSQAFERFVNSEDSAGDVIGLMAYALFKQSVREDALSGNASPASRRAPTKTTVQAYRHAAKQQLSSYVDQAIENRIPTPQESAMVDRINTLESDLKAHIDRRTSWAGAVTANLVAWLLSLAILFLAIVQSNAPDPQDIVRKVGRMDRGEVQVGPPQGQSSAQRIPSRAGS